MSSYARAGGLLRYGIPDFKMEKQIIDRRVAQMEGEGVIFHFNVDIGVTRPFRSLLDRFDAVLLAGGAERPRDLTLPGIALVGCHYAMPLSRPAEPPPCRRAPGGRKRSWPAAGMWW